MRNLYELDRYRRTSGTLIRATGGYTGDETCGAFLLPSPIDSRLLRVIAASESGWDHVSVSRGDRCPTWREMEFIKRRFFKPDETAMQLHVPPQDHINTHPFCLHLWRPHAQPIPLPPPILV